MNFRIIVIEAVLILQLCSDSISQYMPPSMMGMQPMMQQMSQPMPGMPMPMPMPGMPIGMPQSKIPVVVMPYYSKQQDKVENGKTKKKGKKEKNRKKKYIIKKKKRKSSGSTSASDSDQASGSASYSEEKYYRTKPKRRFKGKKKREILTPVVSYVTKNGRVVYQTKIKNENVKDWLVRDKNRRQSETEENRS